jgi:hypothetical protein
VSLSSSTNRPCASRSIVPNGPFLYRLMGIANDRRILSASSPGIPSFSSESAFGFAARGFSVLREYVDVGDFGAKELRPAA